MGSYILYCKNKYLIAKLKKRLKAGKRLWHRIYEIKQQKHMKNLTARKVRYIEGHRPR